MSRKRTPEGHDELTDEERIAAIGELLVMGAIAAVGLSEGGTDRGPDGGNRDESEGPENARSP